MVERLMALVPGGEIGAARGWALEQVERFRWGAWRPDPVAVALVVSELVTNAQRHAGGRVALSLLLEVDRLRIAVSDDSRRWPVQHDPDPARVGGHGLHIVAKLASSWGVRPHGAGKQVWADLVSPHFVPVCH